MVDGINCCSVSPSKKRSLPNALWHDPYSDLSITNSTRPAAGSHEDHQVPSPQKRIIKDYDYECNESSNGDSNDCDCAVTNDNDESSLSRDLEMTPSYGGITQSMKELTLQEETGDELQNKAIALACKVKTCFLLERPEQANLGLRERSSCPSNSNKKPCMSRLPQALLP